MAKKRYQVAVDTWGSAPQFVRGRILELDLDDEAAMKVFPYDAQHALDNGILIDLDEQEAKQKAEQAELEKAAKAREAATAPRSSGAKS